VPSTPSTPHIATYPLADEIADGGTFTALRAVLDILILQNKQA
jgi:hypothetical protein